MMSSFTKQSVATDAPPESEAASQGPLGLIGGGDTPIQVSDAPVSRRKLPTSVVLLLLVLAVAAAALYVMRVSGTYRKTDADAAAAEQQINQALASLAVPTGTDPSIDQPVWQDTDQVVAMFASDPAQLQVAVEKLQKNPFEVNLPKQQTQATDPSAAQQATNHRATEQRRRALNQEASSLVLQSVMSGRQPLAVISGRVVKEGDTLGSFRVASIDPMAVVLDAEGSTYQLRMDQSFDGLTGD